MSFLKTNIDGLNKAKTSTKLFLGRVWQEQSESKKLLYVVGVAALASGIFFFKHQLNPLMGNKPSVSPGNGLTPKENENMEAFVFRPELEKTLDSILKPAEIKKYIVLLGKKGVGKTTAIRRYLSNMKDKNRFAYIAVPEDTRHFEAEIKKALGFKSGINVEGGIKQVAEGSATVTTPDIAVYIACLRAFVKEQYKIDKERAEFERSLDTLRNIFFKASTRSPSTPITSPRFILVIDAADRLAHQSPEILRYLQEVAKESADAGDILVVFISSDGSAPEQMKSRGAISRCKFFEIGEIPDEDAVKLLVEKNKVSEVDARAWVRDVSGGIFTLLSECVPGVDREGELNAYFAKTNFDLQKIGVLVDNKIFQVILDKGFIDSGEAVKLITLQQLEALLKTNILAADPNARLKFHYRHNKTFFERRSKAAEEARRRWFWLFR